MKPCPKSAVEDAWNTPEVVRFVAKRFVVEKFVAKKFVEVEFDVVLLVAVNAWRVDDPFIKRFPEASEPEIVADPPNKLVNEPVVEKKFVEVAFVDVEF